MAANPKSPAAQHFDLSCPDGGKFYICEGSDNEFIGCCTSHPCADSSGICPQANLRTSSFAANKSDDLETQSCDDSRGANVWYKCQNIDPPFMGCCDVSPCGEGCPRSKLLPAVLSPRQNNRQSFLNPESDSSSTTASAATSTASTSSLANSDDSGGLSTAAIAGIAAGSAAIGVILIALLIWKCWCRP